MDRARLARTLLIATLAFVPAALSGQVPPPECTSSCSKWAVCEITLQTLNAFSESSLYTNVRVKADISRLDAFGNPVETKSVPGFLFKTDASGTGTYIGTYKIRFTPTVAGARYRYTTASAYQGLGGKSDEFDCGDAPMASHGFLRRSTSNPGSFAWDDGSRQFLWGQTYYQIVNRARFEPPSTPPYLNVWQDAIINTNTRSMSKVRLLISPWTPKPYTTETQPYVGTDTDADGDFDSYNRDQLNLAHWDALDKVVQFLNEHSMVAEIILFRDPLLPAGVKCPCTTCLSLFGTDVQDKRYLRYAIARYAAYPNVIWSLSNEWQCTNKSKAYFDGLGTCIRSGCTDSGGLPVEADPWIVQGSAFRPLTIHPYAQSDAGRCFDFLTSAWPVHGSLQFHKGTLAGDTWGQDSIACNKRADAGSCPAPSAAARNIPFINDEYGYFGDFTRLQLRNAMWGIATAGGYGTAGDNRPVPMGTGDCTQPSCASPIGSTIWYAANEYGDLQRMIDFFRLKGIPFWSMVGDDACGATDRIHVLRNPVSTNVQYVIYFAVPGSLAGSQVQAGSYDTLWYNPRINSSEIAGCANVTAATTFTTPTSGSGEDWALWLKKRSTACP